MLIERVFGRLQKNSVQEQMLMLTIIKYIADKHPRRLTDFFPKLCDDQTLPPGTLTMRIGTIAAVGGVDEV